MKHYSLGQCVIVQITGCLGNFDGKVVSISGRATPQHPYIKVEGWPVLKSGDYIIVDSDVEVVIRRIHDPQGNELGLTLKKQGGKYYWSIWSERGGDIFHEIPTALYLELMRYELRQQAECRACGLLMTPIERAEANDTGFQECRDCGIRRRGKAGADSPTMSRAGEVIANYIINGQKPYEGSYSAPSYVSAD